MPRWREGSTGEYLEYLLPGCTRGNCPSWAPDLFAITASVLRRTGLYTRLFDIVAQGPVGGLLPLHWPALARRLSEEWRLSIGEAFRDGSTASALPPVPPPLEQDWRLLLSLSDTPMFGAHRVRDEARLREYTGALLRLCLVADEGAAIAGAAHKAAVVGLARERLLASGGRTLGWLVRPEKVRVLPKHRTPYRGLTLRALSRSLALIGSDEVDATWTTTRPVGARGSRDPDALHVLVLPWPLRLRDEEFVAIARPGPFPNPADQTQHFHVVRRPDPEGLLRYAEARLRSARDAVGEIGMVVLPELSLTSSELEVVLDFAKRAGLVLVGGAALSTPDPAGNDHVANVAVVDTGVGPPHIQRKHHRWRLDRAQIEHYGLADRLRHGEECSELTEIGPRELRFFSHRRWLTFCVLVCEDLARQDPLAEVIRSVGPNLAVVLLLDGPQLSGRWASRYASILAEDPGCSVLAVTSMGMAERSRPREAGRTARNEALVLWRDYALGERELSVLPGHDAGVLSLANHPFTVRTADGRGEAAPAFLPTFAGWQSLGGERPRRR